MQRGWRMTFEMAGEAHRLSASRRGGDGEIWSLALGEGITHPDIDELVVAGKKGDQRAASRLREIVENGDPSVVGPAQAAYGRVMLARGEMNEAEPALRRALAADRAEGRLSDEMRDGTALIWALAVLQQRFADARAVLESLAATRDKYPEGQAKYADSEGLLAAETGDLRTALASYRKASRVSERLGRTGLADSAAENLARILAVMGRNEEAASILERLPSKEDPCAHASLTINRVDALMGTAMHNGDANDARISTALLDEQRATSACPDPHRRLIAAVDAARHALSVDARPAADVLVAALLRAESRAEDALTQAWRLDVLATWSLARGRSDDALKSFGEEAAIARSAGLWNEAFRGEIGTGEALLALGRHRQGIVHLKAAQTIQERTLESIPLGEGRGEFLSSHDEGVRHLVDALVDGGSAEEAMTVARVARATEANYSSRQDRLATLSTDQRRQWDGALERRARIRHAIEKEALEDWKLPAQALARVRADREIRADEARDALDSAYRLLIKNDSSRSLTLSAPRASEVQIVFFPGAKDWIAFTRTTSGVKARRFRSQALDSNEAASAVLEQLSCELATAHRVRIFPFGRADRVDWHAVYWRAMPLVSRIEVEYGLDLPDSPDRARIGGVATTALVIANPTGDLRAASDEGDLVARALDGWRVTHLNGNAATRDALLTALPEVGLFHYAGHAEVAGPSGALSALVLAGGARAQLGDLLTLPRLPSVVVLSACQAAATEANGVETGSAVTLGLAQAFLAVGARAVLAPTREVADTDAQSFMTTLYQDLASRGLSALSEAFRSATLQAVGRSSQSFRLIVP